ncbi:MAG: ASKHA domain-containing protein [Blautia sp.]
MANRERLRMAEGMQAFYVTDQVYLTQKDIREVQLAKGAMAAGISLMCKELGISPGQIQEVLIAGAFGNYMDSSSACGIGLIPAELKDRIHPVGNAAGEGAKLAVISQREFEHACEIYRKVEFMELAAKADFQDVFVDELEFPEGM